MEGKSIDKTTRKPVKGYRGIGMDWMAKWYAKNTRTNMAYFQTLGRRLAENLPDGSSVLEVAPGPGT